MNTQDEYIKNIVHAYKAGDENAFEVYQRFYEFRRWDDQESDIEFIERCAALDFGDGTDQLVYPDVYEAIRDKDIGGKP